MKYKAAIHLISFAFVFIIILSAIGFIKPNTPATNGFAVVELFTSEGCSSCPSADEALGSLIKDYPSNVSILAFHVDYWNNLGWKDPYSHENYTSRQQQYGATFHLSSIYTPQAVVNGSKEFVGSNRTELHATINKELETAANQPIELAAYETGKNKIRVQFTTAVTKSEELNIALVQLFAINAIKKGENHGKTLHHYNIVRSFQTFALYKTGKGVAELIIPEGLSIQDCKVIAYTQQINSRKITGVKETGINLK